MESSQHILVLGLGISGEAAADLALQLRAAVTVLDAADGPKQQERAESLRNRGVDVRLGWNQEKWTGAAPTLAVLSPGVPPASVLGRLSTSLTCPVIGELEFGFRHVACPVLAITGTNGKTTTTELLAACLKQAGKRVLAAGNIGVPLCEAARKSGQLDFLVVEVSSFQLETCERFAPLAAAVLNITPDHLDRYGGMGDYTKAKALIFRNMPDAGKIVLRPDVAALPEIRTALPKMGTPVLFSSTDDLWATYFLAADGMLCRREAGNPVPLMHRDQLKLKGAHNIENALAVIALAELAGVPFAAIRPGLEGFAPSPHRLELVTVANGVRYINDSKATNPDSVVRALETVAPPPPGKVLLIAGGLDKDVDFSLLTPVLPNYVKEIFLIGKCREMLAHLWRDMVYCQQFSSLEAAVDAAIERAAPGDVVLLSPGCASMDMFTNYAERGEIFRKAVKRRVGE